MKVDRIIKNAKIFTANTNNLQATALVVKDGKFIYVGDEADGRALGIQPQCCERGVYLRKENEITKNRK